VQELIGSLRLPQADHSGARRRGGHERQSEAGAQVLHQAELPRRYTAGVSLPACLTVPAALPLTGAPDRPASAPLARAQNKPSITRRRSELPPRRNRPQRSATIALLACRLAPETPTLTRRRLCIARLKRPSKGLPAKPSRCGSLRRRLCSSAGR
jgi:hypothetical protein